MEVDWRYRIALTAVAISVATVPIVIYLAISTGEWRWLLAAIPGIYLSVRLVP